MQRADVLLAAGRRVKANAGAAGVDGVTIEEIIADPETEAAWLSALQEELHRKRYRPAPVRQVKIPKPSGRERALGLPTVQDLLARPAPSLVPAASSVLQMAVYLVLMPIFEADFHPHSYGFRPGRGAAQAVEAIRMGLRTGRTEVVDADLAQYFDSIPPRRRKGQGRSQGGRATGNCCGKWRGG